VNSAAPRLEGRELSCVRDGRALFKSLNLHLDGGEILRVEGANGAGKTSLLRILCGLAQPRDGAVYWKGADISDCRFDYHRELLYIGHNPGIKEELTSLENLRFFHALGGHGGEAAALQEALAQVGLYGYEEATVRTLSAGQRRRVALARLWLSEAPLWVLDEPFTAIDRDGIRNLQARLVHHAHRGGMAVLTSHQPLSLEGCAVRSVDLS
jgi:heme exporter protein A